MIALSNSNKIFRAAKRQAGFGRDVKALFSREYQLVPALNDISFTSNDSEMVGYISPNGAGKSTTIKIMCAYSYHWHHYLHRSITEDMLPKHLILKRRGCKPFL